MKKGLFAPYYNSIDEYNKGYGLALPPRTTIAAADTVVFIVVVAIWVAILYIIADQTITSTSIIVINCNYFCGMLNDMSDLPTYERKQIENEMFFRKANEKIGAGIDALNKMCEEVGALSFKWNDALLMKVICECSDENCEARIGVRWSVYQTIHGNRDTFIVTPGHQVAQIESVVSREDGYNIVIKNNSTPIPRGKAELHDTDIDNG